MSQTFVAAPRARSRFRILLAALVAAGAIAALVGRHSTAPLPAPIGPERLVCEEDEPPVVKPAPPPKPRPPAGAYDQLEACLRAWRASDGPGAIGPYLRHDDVTVAKVRHWVEVDGDPAWFYEGVWDFPLSGEGDAQMPSGLYGAVPGCQLSIVN